MVDGINSLSQQNYNVKLQDRGKAKTGITFELKNIFSEMQKNGQIKDTNGDDFSAADAKNLYEALNKMHKDTGRSTDYSKMSDGTEFTYTAAEMQTLLKAAGYEVVDQKKTEEKQSTEAPKIKTPPTQDQKPVDKTKETEPSKEQQIENKQQTQETPQAQTKVVAGKVLTRSVNGENSQIAVVQENGQKVHYQIGKDGALGEKLVTVSTAGKNKYVTQSKFDADVRTMLGLGEKDKIPSELKPEYVTIGGESSIVIKKDGKVMDSKSIKGFMSNYKAQNTVEQQKPVDLSEAVGTIGTSNLTQNDTTKIDTSAIKNIKTSASTKTATPKGVAHKRDGMAEFREMTKGIVNNIDWGNSQNISESILEGYTNGAPFKYNGTSYTVQRTDEGLVLVGDDGKPKFKFDNGSFSEITEQKAPQTQAPPPRNEDADEVYGKHGQITFDD